MSTHELVELLCQNGAAENVVNRFMELTESGADPEDAIDALCATGGLEVVRSNYGTLVGQGVDAVFLEKTIEDYE